MAFDASALAISYVVFAFVRYRPHELDAVWGHVAVVAALSIAL